jgi:hypothetical protein
MELSSSDYKKIVNYYQIPKQNDKTYKTLAEDMLADKLCKCIKSVTNKSGLNEKSAIGICRDSIFKKRNIDFYTFGCKKQAKLHKKKNTRRRVKKFSKSIAFDGVKKTKTVKKQKKKLAERKK